MLWPRQFFFSRKCLTLKDKKDQGEKCWWHALLLNTIFQCSKLEILMVLKLQPGQNVDDEDEK